MNAMLRLLERWQMPVPDERLPVLLAAVLAAATVYTATRTWRLTWGRTPDRLLADYYAMQEARETRDRGMTVDREAIILLSLGLPPRRSYLTGLRVAGSVLVFLVLTGLGYPALLSLALGGVGYVLVHGFLDARWHAFRMSVERDLPLVAARLSGVLQITSSPAQALESVVETLPEGRPVRTFLEHALARVRARGPSAFMEVKEAAATISPSLATMVLLMGRLSETGGATYAQAFLSVADELFAIARVRAVAAGKAHSARLNVYIILAALTFGSLIFMNTPSLRATMSDPTVQVAQVMAIGVLLVGFKLINDMIQRAMEV